MKHNLHSIFSKAAKTLQITKTAMLLVVTLMLMPQEAVGKGRWQNKYLPGGDNKNKVNINNSTQVVTFDVCIYDANDNDAGFDGGQGNMTVQFSKDGGNSYTTVFSGSCNTYGDMNVTGLGFQSRNTNDKTASFSCDVGSGTVKSWWGNEDNRWLTVSITLNRQWRNCNIKVYASGKWVYYEDWSAVSKSAVSNITSTYTHTVRSIKWSGGYTVSSDGTVTIPYKFEGSGNTDGETHICTRIDNSYNSNIGFRYPTSNYANGSYTFKLADIKKDMLSSFTIQPYHEFTHNNDKDASNSVKYYCSYADAITFQPLPKPNLTLAELDQENRKVHLEWQCGEYTRAGGKFVVYRRDSIIGSVNHDINKTSYSFDDMDTSHNGMFPYEEDVIYFVYFVENGWSIDTKVTLLRATGYVNTSRSVPIKEPKADSKPDRIVLTWQSDGYPKDWGNYFYIYVDNALVDTIIPRDYQTSFQWEHRTVSSHTNRVNGIDTVVNGIDTLLCWYTEEPLNGAVPHNYRVESMIGDKNFEKFSANNKGIGTGTEIIALEASKGAYSDKIKLTWRVDQHGSTAQKTYFIARYDVKADGVEPEIIHSFNSNTDNQTYIDDTPLTGVYYTYIVTVQDITPEGAVLESSASDIGFAQSTGTVSGRITYGSSGMAVSGVSVEAKQTGDDQQFEQHHAIRLTSNSGVLKWNFPSTDYAKNVFNSNYFSVQMWVNPGKSGKQSFVSLKKEDESDVWTLGLDAQNKLIVKVGSSTSTFNKLSLKTGEYNHISVSREKQKFIAYMVCLGADSVPYVLSDTVSVSSITLSDATYLSIGGFTGYVDEFRLWTKELNTNEILDFFDCQLLGSEKYLETYWPFDEGLADSFFDISKEGAKWHEHHGTIVAHAQPSPNVPKQLKLKAKTDKDGNYIIRGIPFSGAGTTYAIIPRLGVHAFNPTQQLRYVCNNSLVHNGTDFEDISSFTVRGTVYYEGTDVPVAGCSLYVDGEICTKDGETVTTKDNGLYEISVPIGEHFIQIKKEGHTFACDGRYPEDPNNTGTRIEFTAPVNNLDFKDMTLVNLTGRVVGGNVEGDKPIGFGLSKNNIGIATLTLALQEGGYRLNVKEVISGTRIDIQTNDKPVPVPSANSDIIESKAWRGVGENDCKKIFIRTDSMTGEFSAMVPPLAYVVEGIQVDWSGMNVLNNQLFIDMSNPLTTGMDSLVNKDGEMQYYSYHTLLRQTYHPENATFTVRQYGHDDGSFGIDKYVLSDELGKLTLNDIHHINADTVEYTYGYPLFKTLDPYLFIIEGYEQFVNKDSGDSVVSKVPMVNTVVTIDNALSAEQSVYTMNNEDGAEPGSIVQLQSNQLMLDSNGKAFYEWYGGYPNISGDHTRTLNIYYGEDRKEWEGNPLTGIVLGNFPTGNNFITSGPDHVDMILRDPPGSQSYATWETGTVTNIISYNTDYDSKSHSDVSCIACKKNWYLDFSLDFAASGGDTHWSAGGSISLVRGVLKKNETLDTYTRHTNTNTTTRSVTVSKAISTSANPEYDGPDADLFIGSSTNYIIGDTRKVALYRNPADTTKAIIDMQDDMGVGVSYKTDFVYSRYHIEHTLLPEIKKLRNELLTTVGDTSNVVNQSTTRVMYATTLEKTNPKFGEKGTYKPIAPAGSPSGKRYEDSVSTYNTYIQKWIEHLTTDEIQKVEAYRNRADLSNKKQMINYSYDAGTSITISNTVSNEHSVVRETIIGSTVHYHEESGYAVLGVLGRQNHNIDDYIVNDTTFGLENDTIRTTTFSYTLQDNDAGDALSVDVYNYGAYGPIFRTRGGQTSNPYEGEVQTTYYYPGTVIMESTAQVDMPKIDAEPRTRSNVPSGSAATYELRLQNWSETGVERPYKLMMAEHTNPNGAQLLIDGMPLTDGRIIRVPGGQEIKKTLQLKQSNLGILNYDSIGIVFASVGQSDPMSGMPIIADTVYINAYFVPSSSPVTMALSNTTLNTQTGAALTITMKDFDRNFYHLKAFRLQYKPQGGNWTQFHEYVLNESDLSGTSSELLPKNTASVQYTLPMANLNDGNYMFRIVSVSTSDTKEIYVYSNELTLVKDMSRPRAVGLPEPADGILDIVDELSITFNEAILPNELTNTRNFLVTGVLNGNKLAHDVALRANEGIATPAAQTESNINLSNRDFSIDMWMYISGAGTLLRHGNGKQVLMFGTNEEGQAVIGLGEDSYTSQNVLPRDKWLFCTLAYYTTLGGGGLNVAIAYDDHEQVLFDSIAATRYEGNGPLCIGCGADAAFHELILWDNARDLITALAQRNVSKTPATRYLAGYWKMNEGEGTTIRDYARNRNMTMSGETWYMNNINKALELDGTHYVTIYTGGVAPMQSDDYAIEFWLKAGQQTDTATLFQLGEVSMWLDNNGALHLQNNDNDQIINHNFEILNNTWHHIALNVLRLGTTAVYIDGERALTIPSANIGSLASDSLLIGVRRTFVEEADTTYYKYDRHLSGSIDEIRLWHATMNADLLATNRKTRLEGNEAGLSLYYPFEKKTIDEFHQVVTVGTLEELTGHGKEAIINGQMPNGQINEQMVNDQMVNYTDDAPTLKEKLTETNVPFTFTAVDKKIVIDIDEEPAKIEGCTLHFTVRDVRDVNGNYSVPATWSAFVHRGELSWADEALEATQPVKTSTTLTTAIANRSGKAQMWEITNIPSWLTVSPSSGTLNPLEQVTVTFTTDEATAIGHYEQTLYLATTDSIEQPLAVRLKVTGNVPEWSVNPNDYDMSMNIIGQLDIFGLIAEDEEDLVAAFINDTCRGVAHPTYKARYDGYYITMDVYGTAADNDKELSFRAYDASTGVLYPLVEPDREIKFTAPALVGSYAAPVKLSVSDKIEQTTLLKRGWNWLSLYVQTEDMHPKTLLEPIAEDVKQIKGHSNLEGVLMRDKDGWSGNMDTLRNSKMYLIQMENDRTLRLVGKRIDPQNCLVNLANGWTWAGYYGRQISSVTDALSGMDPQDGDILKGQRGIAYYDDYEWAGSLAFMEPGLGYMIYNTAADKSFAYPFVTVAMAPRRAPITNHKLQTEFTPVDYHQFDGNMTLIAQLLKDGQPLPNTELGIFAGDECRAVAVSDDEGKFITLIPGDETVTLSFKVAVGEEILEASQTLEYVTNATAGTTEQPLLITFVSGTTGVGEGQITNDQSQTTNAHKELRHGILYILRNGKTYNAQGAEVK